MKRFFEALIGLLVVITLASPSMAAKASTSLPYTYVPFDKISI